MSAKINKTVYNKLVRDKIPEIIQATGKKANYRILNREEYKQALKDKLLEEVNEFLAAQTRQEMQEEMDDIKEVLAAIHETFRLGRSKLNSRYAKALDKGCFGRRVFLESVEEIIDV